MPWQRRHAASLRRSDEIPASVRPFVRQPLLPHDAAALPRCLHIISSGCCHVRVVLERYYRATGTVTRRHFDATARDRTRHSRSSEICSPTRTCRATPESTPPSDHLALMPTNRLPILAPENPASFRPRHASIIAEAADRQRIAPNANTHEAGIMLTAISAEQQNHGHQRETEPPPTGM
jgi:hypothetical protein